MASSRVATKWREESDGERKKKNELSNSPPPAPNKNPYVDVSEERSIHVHQQSFFICYAQTNHKPTLR